MFKHNGLIASHTESLILCNKYVLSSPHSISDSGHIHCFAEGKTQPKGG